MKFIRVFAASIAMLCLSTTAGAKPSIEPATLYSKEQLRDGFEACATLFPSRAPDAVVAAFGGAPRLRRLCSDSFAVVYSGVSKTPLVVVERLTAQQLQDAKGEERTDEFFADPRIPRKERAELEDFRAQQPAVDRGHMAPAADAPNQRSMAQSFALSNMVPQDPVNNRKIWNKIEQDVRKYASRAPSSVYVFSGPLFDPGHETVGPNKVWKPTRLFKLVYDEGTGRAWGWVIDNAEVRVGKPVSYPEFVALTGYRFLDGTAVR